MRRVKASTFLNFILASIGCQFSKRWPNARPPSGNPSSLPTLGIHSLPVEIMMAIFVYCDVGTELPILRSHFGSSNLHITISQVCRRWREIAFSMSQLWSHLTIDVPRHWCEPAIQRGPIIRRPNLQQWASLNASLENWFLHAGGRPSTLWLERVPHQVVRTIVGHISQCECLIMYHDPQTDGSSWTDVFLASNVVMPNLHFLSLVGPASLKQYIPFLSALSNLQSLVLYDVDLKQFTASDRLYHVRIESLQLLSSEVDPMKCLGCLTLPSLRTIAIACCIASSDRILTNTDAMLTSAMSVDRSYSKLDDFLNRSSCTIRSFSIAESYIPPDYFERYLTLPALQQLESLSIINDPKEGGVCMGIPDQTLELLRYPLAGQDKGHFPVLKGLRLENVMSTDGLLTEIISSRLRPTTITSTPDASTEIHSLTPLERLSVVFNVDGDSWHGLEDRVSSHQQQDVAALKVLQSRKDIEIDWTEALHRTPRERERGRR